MKPVRRLPFALPVLVAAVSAACGDEINYYGENPEEYPLGSSFQVVYRPGDALEYLYSGTLVCAEGTYVMTGWFTIMTSEQGLTNPLTGEPVLTLIENQDLAITLTGPDGTTFTSTVNDYAYRYFVQDPATGTIEYWGDRIKDAAGAFFTVWFEEPYIPISSPFSVGQRETATYDRYLDDGEGNTSYMDTHTTTVTVTGKETVPTDVGNFETYVMSWHDDDTGHLVRYQYVHPALGIVRFDFPTSQPGCAGNIYLDLIDTNMEF